MFVRLAASLHAVFLLSFLPATVTPVLAGNNEWSLSGELADSEIPSGSIHSIAISRQTSSNLYAATDFGVYRSTDAGENWVDISNGLAIQIVRAIAVDPADAARLYVATEGAGIAVSTDSGASWTAINEGLTDLEMTHVTIDPGNPDRILAVSSNHGIFGSIDGGANWTPRNEPFEIFSREDVTAIAIDSLDPDTIYAGLTNFDGGVYKTIDDGATWEWQRQQRRCTLEPSMAACTAVTMEANPGIRKTAA